MTTKDATTTMAATTQTIAPSKNSKVTGIIVINAAKVNLQQMSTASKKTLALKFGVNESAVTLTVTEARRLAESIRRLAGIFSIAYTITASAARKADMEAKATSFKQNTNLVLTEMVKQLVAAGVEQSVADGASISSMTAAVTLVAATTQKPTTPTSVSTASATPGLAFVGRLTIASMIALCIGAL